MIIIDTLSSNACIDSILLDIDGTITRWKNIGNFLEKALNILDIPYNDDALLGLFKAMEYREYYAITTGEADERIYSMLLESYIEVLHQYGVLGEQLKNTMFELEATETFISHEVSEEIKLLSENYKLYYYTN